MSFLAPLFLLASVAVAVPLYLHLRHRHDTRTMVFPALRYLLRTEKEHARRIRLRQLLLLLLRVATVLLLVAAGARLFLPGGSAAHVPTAVAVILDNSLSTSRVAGEERLLDALADRARETVLAAGAEDRIWVIRAGEPWDVAAPGGADAALKRIDETVPSAARGDLSAALRRARALVGSADLPAGEIHLLTDLQATAFTGASGDRPAGDVPVLVHAPEAPTDNRFVAEVVVGGGLPPVEGRRTEVAVTLGPEPPSGEPAPDPLPVRMVVDGRVRGAGSAAPGEAVVLPVGPFADATVTGYVATEPDALRADDRRHFVFTVRPPVRVGRSGAPARFLDEALGVLREAGRIRLDGGVRSGEGVTISVAGAGMSGAGGGSVVIVPPTDPTLLPGLNRRLADAGVPWRYEAPAGAGETGVEESRLPVDLGGIPVRRHYRLRPVGTPPPAASVPARLGTGDPLIVAGSTGGLRHLLLAVPLDPGWSGIPVSASMLPLLEWAVLRWGAGDVSGRSVVAGEPLPLPPGATAVRDPGGTIHAADGSRSFRATGATGVWEVLAGEEVVGRVAVNPPTAESRLGRLEPERLAAEVGEGAVLVADPLRWSREIFRARQGPELWRPLLAVALLLLLLESWLAASGAQRKDGARGTRTGGRGASLHDRPAPPAEGPTATAN